jgi:alkanesulfonate monooxygenase SsuD/methylene tetrahydromethanopterin reductase-like flavin-dependent oxidoreductase (luciferase family)
MEFGIFHEFLSAGAGSQTAAFAQSFAQIEAAERWGLDIVWLAEIHMNPTRSLLSAPLTVASAIAARTQRIRIGTAVQILPLGHPLRLAEETATIDQISGGRLVFGVGRSAFPRAYDAYGIPYQESQDRFAESLEIIKRAWTEPVCSHHGVYWKFENFTLVPRPLQVPHPPIRIAASQPDTYGAIGTAGYPGRGEAYLQVPVYVAATAERAAEEAREGLMRFATYRADLLRGPLTYEAVLQQKGIVGTPDMVAARIAELQETAGLDGISAEINVGSMLSHAQVMESLRLYCLEVMPRFK